MDTQLKQLNRLFAAMDKVGRQALLEYAEFLQARHPRQQPVSQEPLAIERPAEESVVVAIKRLSRTYPMLESGVLLHEASAMLTQHMIHGRPAQEVIDDLEQYFLEQYEKFVAEDVDVRDS